MKLTAPDGLAAIERLFAREGFELVFVGGCVRDAILGLPWKDVDLATSATPEEQMAIYDANGIRYFETGLKHGTLTVVIDGEPYEVTTYRTDVKTDGRHAEVAYVRHLVIDLQRRDLTINAMAMRFDGTLVDPFGGEADARAGIIRFVGEADRRLQEDYLRILRWFRFTGRFIADGARTDEESVKAVIRNAKGLADISVERIWSETSRIITGPNASRMIALMSMTGVSDVIGLPGGNYEVLSQISHLSPSPAAALGAYLADKTAATALGAAWKMSNEEKRDIRNVAERSERDAYGPADAKLDMVDGVDRQTTSLSLRLRGLDDEADALAEWQVPTFPVDGTDLLARGLKQGTDLGRRMREMRTAWIASDYASTKDDLLAMVAA